MIISKIKKKLSYYQVVALAYLILITLGTLLLMLPVCSKKEPASFFTALFTATNATCITGMTLVDTFTQWSTFGQVIILLLVQVGGMGFMTLMALLILFFKKGFTLNERTLFSQSTSNAKLGSLANIIKNIAILTFSCELLGALLLMTRFVPVLGWRNGVWASLFHSVNSFCNSGYDIMGILTPDTSLTAFSSDIFFNIVTMMLILTGGMGFLVWNDLMQSKFKLKKIALNTFIVLIATIILLVGGTTLFLAFEWSNAYKDLSFGQKLLAALFQSVTSRTAGFYTVPQSRLTDASRLLTMVLMFIGGSSGSTAGGIKTATFVVLIMVIISFVKRNQSIVVGKRRLDESNIHEAMAVISLYLITVIISGMALCVVENLALAESLFMSISALSNTGLMITDISALSKISQILLMLLMFLGRVGALSLVMVFAGKTPAPPVGRPAEKIIIG